MKYNPVRYIEFFHLSFLDQLGRKLDKRLYSLKGGCNLRFFLGSIRYSQDIDLDVKTVGVVTLQKIVNTILTSPALGMMLRMLSLQIDRISEPKQTETTQHWKIQLKGLAETIFPTKIEFSRRGLENPIDFGPIDSAILNDYRIHPLFVPHYGPLIAFNQKVRALASRSETQARDIWDIFHLIHAYKIKERDRSYLTKACENACNISYGDFKDQVLAFLPSDLQPQYDQAIWDKIQFKVLDYLESLQ